MKELSVFIDESGDFGDAKERPAYYLVTFVFRNQDNDIHLNPVKAHMVNNPEDYGWSSYRSMLGISDDKLTARDRTLSYFKGKDVYGYREFVEDQAHKYIVDEKEIRVSIGEDEQWLPW